MSLLRNSAPWPSASATSRRYSLSLYWSSAELSKEPPEVRDSESLKSVRADNRREGSRLRLARRLAVQTFCDKASSGDNCQEGGHSLVVILDIYKAIDGATRNWASAYSHGDHIEDVARKQTTSQGYNGQ